MNVSNFENCLFSIVVSLQKGFLGCRKNILERNTLRPRETTIFYTFLIRYSFKGIFVNQGGSFKITHTISLSICVRGEIDTVGLNLWNKRQHLNNSICF